MKFSFPEKQPSPNPTSCVLLSPAVCACFHGKIVSLSFPFSSQVIIDHSSSSFVLAAVSVLCPLMNLQTILISCLLPLPGFIHRSQNSFLEGWSMLYFTNYFHFSTSVAQHLAGSPSLQNYLPINVQVLYFQQIFPFNRKCALKMARCSPCISSSTQNALRMAGWGSGPGSIPMPDEEPTSHTEIKENISLEL